MRRIRFITATAIALAISVSTLAYWYQGAAQPLAAEEVDRYLETIQAQPQNPGGKHNLEQLRAFFQGDDGKPFYTVNLYKYYDRAQYLEPHYGDISGREAYDRFSQVMVSLLVRRASHPIFGSNWTDNSISEWDRIVIVRYRSRRDMAEIFASSEFAEASAHKWAALEKNDRMLVQALHIPELYALAIMAFIFIGVFYFLAKRNRPIRP